MLYIGNMLNGLNVMYGFVQNSNNNKLTDLTVTNCKRTIPENILLS